MQVVKNILIIILVLWLSIIIFTPKRAIYYKIEQELSKKGVKINEKNIIDGLFSLKIEGLDIYFKGIKIAYVKEINIFTTIISSKIDITNIKVDDSFKAMLPQDISYVKINHNVSSPFIIPIDINGSFGTIEGKTDIKKRKVRLNFVSTYDIEVFKKFLKKDKEGWYYETSF
jgi:hypothetical protein